MEARYYFIEVMGVDGTGRMEVGYRLDLDHPTLQTPPVTPQRAVLAVVSEGELALLRNRGFEVRIRTGPHPDEVTANNALDNMFDYPF